MQRLKKFYPYIVATVIISIIIFLLSTKIDTTQITEIVKRAGVFGPLVYIILMASTQVVAPLSGTPILFAGFGLFGDKIQIYTYLGTLLGSALNFWISRIWGRKLVKRFVGSDLKKVDEFTKEYGVKSLIFLRMFQGNLVDFISYAYGLTNMKFTPYIVITAVAPIPWLLLWQFYILPRVKGYGDFTVWYILTLLPIVIISWFYYRYLKKKDKKTKHD